MSHMRRVTLTRIRGVSERGNAVRFLFRGDWVAFLARNMSWLVGLRCVCSERLLSALPSAPRDGALAAVWREPSYENRPSAQQSRYGILGRQQKSLERRTSLARPTVHTYEEACHVVADLGILPLSSFMPDHPSLDSMTLLAAWHTGTDTASHLFLQAHLSSRHVAFDTSLLASFLPLFGL